MSRVAASPAPSERSRCCRPKCQAKIPIGAIGVVMPGCDGVICETCWRLWLALNRRVVELFSQDLIYLLGQDVRVVQVGNGTHA